MKYKITKEQCQAKISGVCSRCGGELEPLETLDNSENPTFWSGCRKCACFDNGVKPEIYAIAKVLVEENYYRPYAHINHMDDDSDDMKRYKLNSQITGACGLVNNVLSIRKTLNALVEIVE